MSRRRIHQDPLSRVRRTIEFIAPVSHRPERIQALERAVKIVTGEPVGNPAQLLRSDPPDPRPTARKKSTE